MASLGAMELLVILVLAVVLFGGGIGVGVVLAVSSARRRQQAINGGGMDPALAGGTATPAPPPAVSESAPSPGSQAVIAPPEQLDTTRVMDDKRIEIGRALAEGRTVLAVKLYREATGAGLRDAKQAVDYWEKYGTREVRGDGGTGGQWPTLA